MTLFELALAAGLGKRWRLFAHFRHCLLCGATLGGPLQSQIWILTEERPKRESLCEIVKHVCEDKGWNFSIAEPQVSPVVANGRFKFQYRLEGVSVDGISEILVETVSGKSSFVDYLVFVDTKRPLEGATPDYAIEETKTDDSESRNTGSYQRLTKFAYLSVLFAHGKALDGESSKCHAVMYYNGDSGSFTDTARFGARLLKTLGVSVIGKRRIPADVVAFKTVDELISAKANMRRPPAGNVPVTIVKSKNGEIVLTGRLLKSGSLAHDPNIGALSGIIAATRILGWEGPIIITKHGLQQQHLTPANKFVRVAEAFNATVRSEDGKDLDLPKTGTLAYWQYDRTNEKVGSILLSVLLELKTERDVRVIYENHGGCERGYLSTSTGEAYAIPKYVGGDKANGVINLPDLVFENKTRAFVGVAEGKKREFLKRGIEELGAMGAFEDETAAHGYGSHIFDRGVILLGGIDTSAPSAMVWFQLTVDGRVLVSREAPVEVVDAVKQAGLG